MFKRVEKKLAKKKEEEELGITEEIKEAFRFNGVDSDDSSSDESEASSSSSIPQLPAKRKRSPEEDLDGGSDSALGGPGLSASDDSGDDEDEHGVQMQMTVEEALQNPLFIISIQPDVRGCFVCPRKVLKNDTMVSVHMRSQAHQRRMSKFKEAAASVKQDDDAGEVLSVAFAPVLSSRKSSSNDSAPLSKRATKRIAKFEKMKAKRQKHKAAKARSIASRAAKKLQAKVGSEVEASDVVPAADPPKKKLKLDRSSSGKLPPLTKQKNDVLDQNKSKGRQGRPSKELKTAGVKANSQSKLVGKGRNVKSLRVD